MRRLCAFLLFSVASHHHVGIIFTAEAWNSPAAISLPFRKESFSQRGRSSVCGCRMMQKNPNENDETNLPRNLRKMFREQSGGMQKRQPNQQQPDWEAIQEVLNRPTSQTTPNATARTFDSMNTTTYSYPAIHEDEEEEEGVFLDPSTYLQGELNWDGSLRTDQQTATPDQTVRETLQALLKPPPNSPDATDARMKNTRAEAPDQEELAHLWKAMEQFQLRKDETSTEQHEAVFEADRSFWQQSKEFRQGLAGLTAGPTPTRPTTEMEKRQKAAAQSLAQAVDAWQQELEEQGQQQQQHQSKENDDKNKNDDGDKLVEQADETSVTDKDSSQQWARMVDPDSDEVFYWNEETGEMRWEL